MYALLTVDVVSARFSWSTHRRQTWAVDLPWDAAMAPTVCGAQGAAEQQSSPAQRQAGKVGTPRGLCAAWLRLLEAAHLIG